MLISCLTVTQPGRLEELERSIRCFARQTYAEREMVIVHDGGNAFDRDVRELAQRFSGHRIHIDRAGPGSSLGALRSLSVRRARGELVCQWDDDDLYHPERLAAQHRELVDTHSDFCFLTDQLHWFQNTGEFFWDDWNVEPWPMNLIQGTLLGRRGMMPEYPEIARGEDTPVLQTLFRRGAKLAALGGCGYLYIYTYSGKNVWDLAHHGAISQWKRLRRGQLEARHETLTRHLKAYELPMPEVRFPHDEGVLTVKPGTGSMENLRSMTNADRDIVLAKTRHGKFLVPENDYMGQIFIRGEHFEDGLLSRILMVLDRIKNRNVVDVGANFGGHAVPYSNHIQAAVHAFEPQSHIYDLLLKNIAINNCRNVTPYRIALGHEDNLVTTLGDNYELYNQVRSVREPHSIHNYGGIGLGKGQQQVMMKTLDSYNLENIGLIKIDTEGSERLVLYGATRTINIQKPYIVFEQHAAPREPIYEERWKELCHMYSLPCAMRETSIFDLLVPGYGYREIHQIDENNYVAIP